MRAPMSWIRQYVDVPVDQTGRDVAARLIAAGLEVETVDVLGAEVTGPLVVGRVLSVEELTEFKKPIRFCRVEVGAGNGEVVDGVTTSERGIICGASNFVGRRPRRGGAARGRPARWVRDRHASDLRPGVRRDDHLRAGARARRGPQRDHGPARRIRRARRLRVRGPRTRRRGAGHRRHARPRLRPEHPRRRPRGGHGLRPAVRRPGPGRPRGAAAGALGRGPARLLDHRPDCRRPLRPALDRRAGPERAQPAVDAPRAGRVRDAPGVPGRGRDQLRDARAGPAAARLRPGEAVRSADRAPGCRGGAVGDPRPREAHAERRGHRDRRAQGPAGPGRHDGRPRVGDRR